MRSPVLVLACAFALGILAAYPSRGDAALWLAIGAVSLLAGCLALRSGRKRVCLAFVLVGFAAAGAGSAVLFPRRFSPDHVSHLAAWGLDLNQPIVLEGSLAANPLLMPDGIRADLDVASVTDGRITHKARGLVRLRIYNGMRSAIPASALDLHYGDSIRALARIRRPRNDHDPGGFDYRRWIESIHDIYWEGAVDDPQDITHIPGPRAPFVRESIEIARKRLIESIDRLFPPWSVRGKDGAVLKAVLLGDRSSLDSSTIEDFRKSGLYHLLVVAGLHVGLLALLAEGLFRLLRLRESWRAALLLLFLIVFCALVEQRASTLRASLMIGAYVVARLLDRSQPALNAIGLAALALLLYRPAWLFDAGFELSFAAALLIAAVAAPVLARLTEPYRRGLKQLASAEYDLACPPRVTQLRLDLRSLAGWFGSSSRPAQLKAAGAALRALIWLADLVIFSAILQLGLLLPMAAIFHRVTLAGIGLNTLAVPVMTVLLAVAVPVVLLNLALPSLCVLPAKLLALIMEGLFALTSLPRLPQWLSFRVPTPPAWAAWGFVLAVAAIALGLAYHRSLAGAGTACALVFGLVIAIAPFPPAIPSGQFQVTALNCGGGEALFLVLPDRKTLLVGAGGGGRPWMHGGDPVRATLWDPGATVVSPYLWSRGVKRIDAMLLPDARGDYLSGAASMMKNFRLGQIWMAEGASSETWAQSVAANRITALAAGTRLQLGETQLDVLWQRAAPKHAARSSAAGPVLVRASNGEGSILLAADLTREDQANILRAGIPLESRVLEANSAEWSPAFIGRVRPAAVLVISERRGRTHQPLPEDPAFPDVKLLQVDGQGAVTVTMSRGDVSVRKDY